MSRVNARWLSRVNTARFSEEHGHRAAVAACLLLSLQIISIAKMRDTREMTRDAPKPWRQATRLFRHCSSEREEARCRRS